jgi:plastocyanin
VTPIVPAAPPAPVDPPSPAGDVEKVSLQDTGRSGAYIFSPSDLAFSVGDTITLELTSEGESHTFTVDDLGIDVGVDPGSTETLEFTFAEAGTYTLICVPHEVLGMVGTITVQ